MKKELIAALSIIMMTIMVLNSFYMPSLAQENVTNVTLTNVTVNMTEDFNYFINNIMYMFYFILLIIFIKFIQIPLYSIFFGAITVTVSFIPVNIVFYPYTNMLLFLMGLIMIMINIQRIR